MPTCIVSICLFFLKSVSPDRAAGLPLALVSFHSPPWTSLLMRAELWVSPVRRSLPTPVPPTCSAPPPPHLGFLSCLLGHLQQQRAVGNAWCVILLTVLFTGTRSANLQHTRPPCPSPSPRVCPSSCPLHQYCHPTISSPDALFSFCPQSFPA